MELRRNHRRLQMGRKQPTQPPCHVRCRVRAGNEESQQPRPFRLAPCDHRGSLDAGNAAHLCLDLSEFDPVSVHLHLPIRTPQHMEIPVRPDPGEITGPINGYPIPLRVGQQPAGNASPLHPFADRAVAAADQQFPGNAGRTGLAVFVQQHESPPGAQPAGRDNGAVRILSRRHRPFKADGLLGHAIRIHDTAGFGKRAAQQGQVGGQQRFAD